MIDYIKGAISELTPAYAVVETGGIGYFINISLVSYSRMENEKNVKLLIHEVIREDAHLLYGFLDESERQMFRLLIGVSGVGANTARMILSSMTVNELEDIIAGGVSKRLKEVKGIGFKTAERIIVDLKDKIKPTGNTLISQPRVATETFEEALSAMVMLGFARQQAQKTLNTIFDSEPTIKVEAAIKKALTMM